MTDMASELAELLDRYGSLRVEYQETADGPGPALDCQRRVVEWHAWRYGGNMSVVSIAEAWPSPGKPFSVAELDRMPDDGHRYELLDGALVVSPRPGKPELIAFELRDGHYAEAARV